MGRARGQRANTQAADRFAAALGSRRGRRHTGVTFPSEADYFADRGHVAGQIDFGYYWNDELGTYRLTFMEGPEELTALQVGPVDATRGRLEVLAALAGRDEAEHLLEGWADRCTETGSLDWVRRQLPGTASSAIAS